MWEIQIEIPQMTKSAQKSKKEFSHLFLFQFENIELLFQSSLQFIRKLFLWGLQWTLKIFQNIFQVFWHKKDEKLPWQETFPSESKSNCLKAVSTSLSLILQFELFSTSFRISSRLKVPFPSLSALTKMEINSASMLTSSWFLRLFVGFEHEESYKNH